LDHYFSQENNRTTLLVKRTIGPLYFSHIINSERYINLMLRPLNKQVLHARQSNSSNV